MCADESWLLPQVSRRDEGTGPGQAGQGEVLLAPLAGGKPSEAG